MRRQKIAGTSVGGLEAELLEQLWAADQPLGARELAGRLPGPARSYNTVVTVLTRLVGKGLVERAGDGRRYRYWPAGDPDQLTAQAIERLLDAAGDRRTVLAHLVSGSRDPGLLADLSAILRDSDQEHSGGGDQERPAEGEP
jgi:predicted transcriptional regulator